MKYRRLCVVWKITLALSLKVLTRIHLPLPGTESIIWRTHVGDMYRWMHIYRWQGSVFTNTLMKALEKMRLQGDLLKDTLDYFLVKESLFARLYLLSKIHERLHDVPGRPVISNSGYYTGNISSVLDYHLQPLAQNIKSYM